MRYAYALWFVTTAITVLAVFCRNRKYPFGTTPQATWIKSGWHRLAFTSMVITVLGSVLFFYLYFRS